MYSLHDVAMGVVNFVVLPIFDLSIILPATPDSNPYLSVCTLRQYSTIRRFALSVPTCKAYLPPNPNNQRHLQLQTDF